MGVRRDRWIQIAWLMLICAALPCYAEASDPAQKSASVNTTEPTQPVAATNKSTTNSTNAETPTTETTDGASANGGASESNAAASDEDSQQDRPIEDAETRALLVRAEEHYYRGRYHIALKLFQLVIEREPEHALAYRYAGDIYLKRRELDLAEEHLQIARELSEHPQKEWFRLGQVAYLRGNAEDAQKAFETALELRPDFVICRFYLGFVSYRLKRDKTETILHWEEYRRLAPDDPQGPAIDRALVILRDPAYEIPEFTEKDGEPALPESADGADTRVPYQPGRDETEKSDNTGEELININDL